MWWWIAILAFVSLASFIIGWSAFRNSGQEGYFYVGAVIGVLTGLGTLALLVIKLLYYITT